MQIAELRAVCITSVVHVRTPLLLLTMLVVDIRDSTKYRSVFIHVFVLIFLSVHVYILDLQQTHDICLKYNSVKNAFVRLSDSHLLTQRIMQPEDSGRSGDSSLFPVDIFSSA